MAEGETTWTKMITAGGQKRTPDKDGNLVRRSGDVIAITEGDRGIAWVIDDEHADSIIADHNAAANVAEVERQLEAALGLRDQYAKTIDLLVAENLNVLIPRAEAAERQLDEARAALEALAKVQYDDTIEGLRYQIEREDWGDVLRVEETKAAYELTLAALAKPASETGVKA